MRQNGEARFALPTLQVPSIETPLNILGRPHEPNSRRTRFCPCGRQDPQACASQDIAGIAGIPQNVRDVAQCGERRGHAVGALARRADQAPRPSQDEHAGALRRSLYAVSPARRALRQAPPHVGRGAVLRRRHGLRSALGPQIRLRSTPSIGNGRRISRRNSPGSAATSSTCRPSPSTSTSTMPTPRPRRG